MIRLIQMNTSSLGATGRSVGLASVPKDLTEEIMILISHIKIKISQQVKTPCWKFLVVQASAICLAQFTMIGWDWISSVVRGKQHCQQLPLHKSVLI